MYLKALKKAVGEIVFTDSSEVPTAQVEYATKKISVDNTFWRNLNTTERDFIIDHELSHILLNHGKRFKEGCDARNANIAADLAINDILLKKYGGKDKIPTLYCLGYFPEKCGFPSNLTSEEYYSLLRETDNCPRRTLFGSDIFSDNLKKVIGELEEAREKEFSGIEAGTGQLAKALRLELRTRKQKFSEFVKDIAKGSAPCHTYDYFERWGVRERKDVVLLRNSKVLPHAECLMEEEKRVKKNRVLVFLDFSGSCEVLKPIFAEALISLPIRLFDVNAFLFADRICEVDTKVIRRNKCISPSTNIGFGTNFFLVEEEAKKHGYDLVFFFTDGHGCLMKNVPPKEQKKWHVFLKSESRNFRVCSESFPNGFNIHMLDSYLL